MFRGAADEGALSGCEIVRDFVQVRQVFAMIWSEISSVAGRKWMNTVGDLLAVEIASKLPVGNPPAIREFAGGGCEEDSRIVSNLGRKPCACDYTLEHRLLSLSLCLFKIEFNLNWMQ